MNMETEVLWEKKNGILLPRLSLENWAKLEGFPLRPDDVFIATYPKSGTTWMSQIVKLLRTRGKADGVILNKSIPWLEVLDSDYGKTLHDVYPDMIYSTDALSPRVFKSHLPYDMVPGGLPHTTSAKYIYVIRNPKDVYVSYWHHVLILNIRDEGKITWDEQFEEMISGECRFGDWFDHVLGWWAHQDAPNILYVKYEDMIANPLSTVISVAMFIEIKNITDELLQSVVEKSSFASMKKDDTCNSSWLMGDGQLFTKNAQFIRRGIIGDWRSHFNEEQTKRFDARYLKRMSGVNLALKF